MAGGRSTGSSYTSKRRLSDPGAGVQLVGAGRRGKKATKQDTTPGPLAVEPGPDTIECPSCGVSFKGSRLPKHARFGYKSSNAATGKPPCRAWVDQEIEGR